MAKHTIEELYQWQALPLSVKIRMTEERIRDWVREYGVENVYVAESGGKDSKVLVHIARKLYPSIKAIFVDTGLEHDSVRKHGIELADKVLKPKMNFVQVLTRYGYPVISKEVSQTVSKVQRSIKSGKEPAKYRMDKLNGTCIDKKTGKLSTYNIPQWKFLIDAPFRISHKCCDVMKKEPSILYENQTDSKGILATMATESRLRKEKWVQHGCNAYDVERPISKPMSFWTEQDVLQYILLNGLEIADVYGDLAYQDQDGFLYTNPMFIADKKLTTTGAKRTGCVFCMFGITQDPERFVRLKEVEPKKYDYVMRGGKFDEQGLWIPHNGLGYKFVIDWINEHGNMNIKY